MLKKFKMSKKQQYARKSRKMLILKTCYKSRKMQENLENVTKSRKMLENPTKL